MQNPDSGSGFTTSYGSISNVLETEIEIQNTTNQLKQGFTAIWDTGATNSVISRHVVDEIRLQPSGRTFVVGISGRQVTPTFIVNLILPNGVLVSDVTVTLMDVSEHFDVLVGMDIINLGDFAVSNYNGCTTFSFRMPSLETVDFNPNSVSS